MLYCYAARCFFAPTTSGTPKKVASKDKQAVAAPLPPVAVPFRQGDWRIGGDGFWERVEPDSGPQGDSKPQTVRIHVADKTYVLAVLNRDLVTVVMLLSSDAIVDSAMRAQLAGIADVRMARLIKQLTAGVSSLNRWHVPGYRYLYLDGPTQSVRASPEAKLSTLALESMAALSQLRARLEERQPGSMEEQEVCIRTQHDAWVVMRASRGRQLFVVLERAGDTLLEASEATDRFCELLQLLD